MVANLGYDVLGLHLLKPIPDPNVCPRFDVVLIHGVGGHAVQTWKSIWSETCCSDAGQMARVLSFGYSDSHRGPYQQRSLSLHAKTLLERLCYYRGELGARTRPIVLVGHSTGGIIIKKALVMARSEARFQHISACVCGVAFFATPHHGTRDLSWNTIATKIYETAPLSAVLGLKAPAEMLTTSDCNAMEELATDFEKIRSIRVYNFIEDQELGNPVVVGESARLGKMPLPVVELSIKGRSHFNICDLNNDATHDWLISFLKEIADKSPMVKRVDNLPRILGALGGDAMSWDQEVRLPTNGTCAWIEESTEFINWRQWKNKANLLSLEGAMGCGKSYLTKYIADLVVKDKDDAGRHIVAYCSVENTENRDIHSGSVLSGLLGNILISSPEISESLLRQMPELGLSFDRLGYQELLGAWNSVLGETGRDGRRFTLIVDGLDQLMVTRKDKDDVKVAVDSFLRTLMGRPGDRRYQIQPDLIRVLAVLRPDNEPLAAALMGCGFVRYRIPTEKTKQDIALTVREAMKGVCLCHRYDSTLDLEIQSHINKTADGMYLWARLALAEVARGELRDGWQANFLLNNSIFKLYDQILGRLASPTRIVSGWPPLEERKRFLRSVLIWMTYQARPMKDSELEVACAIIDCVGDFKTVSNPRSIHDDDVDRLPLLEHPNMRQAVFKYCAPLIRMRHDRCFEPIHRSLRLYLVTPLALLESSSDFRHHDDYWLEEAVANEMIGNLCMDYLLLPRFEDPGNNEDWEYKIVQRIKDHPFVEYAALHWPYHATLLGNTLSHKFEDHPAGSRERELLDMKRGRHAISWAEVWWYKNKWPKHGPFSQPKDLPLDSILAPPELKAIGEIQPVMSPIARPSQHERNPEDRSFSASVAFACYLGVVCVIFLHLPSTS